MMHCLPSHFSNYEGDPGLAIVSWNSHGNQSPYMCEEQHKRSTFDNSHFGAQTGILTNCMGICTEGEEVVKA